MGTTWSDPVAIALAAAPLAAALVLLLAFRLSGVRAGLLAWGLAVAIAALPGPYRLGAPRLLAANLRGMLISLIVLYVLVAGLLLYNLLERAGAIGAIARALGTATRDPARQALIIVGGLSPFFESVSGFGLAVVIVAPLLLALGFGTRRATLLALLGQNAVPWGAMAIGTLIGAELAGLPDRTMGVGSACLNAPLALLYNVLTVAVAAGGAMVRRRLPDIVLSTAPLAAGVWASSAWVSVELAGVLAGLAAAGAELAYARWAERRASGRPAAPAPGRAPVPGAQPAAQPAAQEAGIIPGRGATPEARAATAGGPTGEGTPLPARRTTTPGQAGRAIGPTAPGRRVLTVGAAFVPYYVLIVGLLGSRLLQPLADWLQERLVLAAPAYGFRLPLVYSPAFFLLLACAAAVVAFRIRGTDLRAALRATLRQWWPAAGATTAFLALSAVMFDSGMTPRLAAAAAAATGPAFALLSPFVGGLGGLMTGSNTGGNAMLIQFQVETARRAGLPPDLLAFANNTAAANATMASPSRVALAAAVTGQAGREGTVLRSILGPVAAAMAILALHVAVWAAIG